MKKERNLILFMPFIGGGGVEKNLFIIANYLSQKINGIKVCTISKDKKKKFNSNIKFLCPKKNFSDNINIRFKYLICLFLLFKFLIKNRNTLVFAFQANIYCIILCKLLNVKVIVRSNSSPSGWYHNILKKIIYKKIISQADEVIVNSVEFKRQMENQFNIKVNCIFNPLNICEIKKNSKNKINDNFLNTRLKIINIGRLTDQKDQITLLKSINILKNKIKIKLLIIGRGVEKETLEKYIKENNLRKFVTIKDFTDNPYPYILKSNLFVLCSKYEGLPNVLLEAASLKKFIISTNCPTGPKEILLNGKAGFLFNVGDHIKLSRLILYYSKNKQLLSNKILIGYKNLHRFEENKNLNMYYQVIVKYLNNEKN